MDAETLWPLTRAAFQLPEKPLYGNACNRCGLCCLMETCPLGLLFFPGMGHGVCPALKLAGGKSHCQLIADPAAVLPPVIAAEVAEMATIMLLSGGTCDAESTPADNAVVDQNPDILGTPSEADGARTKVLMDRIADKLHAAAAARR